MSLAEHVVLSFGRQQCNHCSEQDSGCPLASNSH